MTQCKAMSLLAGLLLAVLSTTEAPAQETKEAYILLIDTSDSMNETPPKWTTTKITEVKRQLAEFCAALPRETRVMIYTFDRKPPRAGPRLVIRDDADRAKLRQFFDDLTAKGEATHAWSSLESVLGEGRTLLKESPNTTVRLLMFTDGVDNENSGRDLDGILKPFDDLLKDRVRMSYISLGFTLGDLFKKTLGNHSIETVPVFDKNELIPLEAAFGWAPARVTTEVDVQFFDKTNARVESRQWDFGDGKGSTEQTPVHRYEKPGKYAVKLSVKGAAAKTDAITKSIEILEPESVVAGARFLPAVVNLGDAVQFINQSKGGVTAFEWDFGDGTKPPTDENPSHVYAKPGEYRVTLTVARGDSKAKVTLDKQVVVKGPPPPVARLFAPQRGMTGEALRFVDVSTGLVDKRSWDFGDGSPPNAEQEPTHTYQKAGAYTVKLTVSGPGGEQTQMRPVEIVAPPKPQPAFVVGAVEVHVDQVVVFTDVTKQPVDRVMWDFGDGTPSVEVDYTKRTDETSQTLQAVRHTFAKGGTFQVALTATGPGGTGSMTKPLLVKAHDPPVAKIVLVSDPRAGALTVFTDGSNGIVKRATWRFGDGTTEVVVAYSDTTDTAQRAVRHTYKQEGTFNVALKVEGPGGADQTELKGIIVKPSELVPKAMFDIDQQHGRGELVVRFTNQSSGPIVRYVWNFGDGSPEVIQTSKQDVEHTYGTGEYTPTLTVEGPQGLAPNTHLTRSPVSVKAPYPAWVKHLIWIVPLAIVLIVGALVSSRKWKQMALIRSMEKLGGRLLYRPSSDPTAGWETILLNDSASEFGFQISQTDGNGAVTAYAGLLRKTVTSTGDGHEETYTLEVSKDSKQLGSMAIENNGRTRIIGPFEFEYRES